MKKAAKFFIFGFNQKSYVMLNLSRVQFSRFRSRAFFILLIFSAVSAIAQPPSGKATPGTVYGAKTDAKNAISASELPKMLAVKDTVSAKVRTKVEDVCSAKGCWLTFKINDKQDGFVKMKDYGFFVPTDLKGKTVILDGISFIKTTSVDDQKHYAEDAKKSQAEIDAITEPKKEVRFIATGILVEK
jgi:hypothetical protein